MKHDQGNIFATLPDNLPEELFETLIDGKTLKMERIVSRGHITAKGEWYDQPWHEWVLVLQGEADLSYVDGVTARLQAGDYVNIPAHTRHRVDWTPPGTNTVWLAIHYAPS